MASLRKLGLFTVVTVLLVICFVSTGICGESSYNYISVKEVKARLDAGDHKNGSLVLTTSQTEKEYKTGNIKAAYPTYARPLKSEADFAKLVPFLNKVKDTDEDIVLICPRGKSGATRPYDYLKKHGVSEKRLMIMEGGQEAFNKAYPNDVAYPEK